MALRGPWGTFIHIPKCAGIMMENRLQQIYQNTGTFVAERHHLPPDTLEDAWTVVRHPADWLRSYYGYMFNNNWNWQDVPDYIHNIFRDYHGMWFPQFVNGVATGVPNAVLKVYDYYCRDGVRWYRLEDINTMLRHIGAGPKLERTHATENKPVMTDEMRDTLIWSENLTLKKYGYEYYG